MPTLIKLLASFLPEPKDLIKYIFFIILIPIALINVLIIIPMIAKETTPLAAPSQIKIYVDAAKEESAGKVNVDWRNLVAIDAVLFDQDFSKATSGHAHDLARRFIREETVTTEETVTLIHKPITRTVTKKVYTLRSLDEVLSELVKENIMTNEQRGKVSNYLKADLTALVDVGSDMPPGWTPNSSQGFTWPAPQSHRITSKFGPRIDPVEGIDGFHKGVDVGGPEGTKLVAARDGTVTIASWFGKAGKAVIIDHGNGYQTRYFHMSRIDVEIGQEVKAGDMIGAMGSTGKSTGPHLHFEIRVNGDPVNPLNYF